MPIAKTHPSYNLFEAFLSIKNEDLSKKLAFALSLDVDGEEISIKSGEKEVPDGEIYAIENNVRALIKGAYSDCSSFIKDQDAAFFKAAKFAGIKIDEVINSEEDPSAALEAFKDILTSGKSEEFKINDLSYTIKEKEGEKGVFQLSAGDDIVENPALCNYALYQLAQKIAFSGPHTKQSIEFCFKYLGDRLDSDLKRRIFKSVEKRNDSTEAIKYLEEQVLEEQVLEEQVLEEQVMGKQTTLESDQIDEFLGFLKEKNLLDFSDYKIENKKIFLRKEGDVEVEINDPKRISYALKEIARELALTAVRDGDVDRFKACRKVDTSTDLGSLQSGAKTVSVVTGDEGEQEFSKISEERQEISKIISEEQLESRNQFRTLARLTRAAFIKNIDGDEKEILQAIENEIQSFSKENKGFHLNGLKAEDMMKFMQDIRIIGQDKKANLDKPVDSDTKELLIPKGDDYSNDSLRNKLFYQQMMITCLEDDHRFISEEHNDRIRSLMRDRIKGFEVADKKDGLLFGEDTVVGMYQRAKIEELRYFEGLPRDVSYESILDRAIELETNMRKREEERKKEERKKKEEEGKKIEEEERKKEEGKKIEEVVFNQVFGFDGLNPDKSMHVQKDEFSVNPSLEAVFKGLRTDSLDQESDSIKDSEIKDSEERRNESASKIQKVFGGYRTRREQLDLKELEEAKKTYTPENLKENDYDKYVAVADEKAIGKYLEQEGQNILIPEVRAENAKILNTGLIIHEFKNGLDGLHKFSSQIDNSATRKLDKESDVEFSLAVISEIPVKMGRDGKLETKDLFCISTANNFGVTKTFVENISEIEKRSQEIYKTNLDYLTLHDGLDIALKSLIKARAEKMGADKGEDRRNMTKGIEELRKCLSGLKPDENDSLQQRQDKAEKLQKRFEDFKSSVAVKDFGAFMSKKLGEEKNEEVTAIKGMLEGKKSTNEQKAAARKHTLKSISAEVVDRVASSTYKNDVNLDFYSDEKKGLTDAFKKGRPFFSKRFDEAGLDSLMSVKMPHAPYPGISISRPRGYGGLANGTVAVTFNIANDNFSNDIAWIALKGCDKPYQLKVSICDRDGDFYVYRNGEKVKETHSKGDIIIDTGVVFKRNAEGKHEAIEVSKIEPKSERFNVDQAIRDQRIKAVSVINGNRCDAALLYEGFNVGTKLNQKTSAIQELDPKKLVKKRDEIETQDIIFRRDKDSGEIIGKDRKFAIISKEDGFNLVLPVQSSGGQQITNADIGFTRPELQFVKKEIDKDGKESLVTEQVELFSKDQENTLSDDAKRKLKEMSQSAFLKFASRFLSEKELRTFVDENCLDNSEQSSVFCDKLKKYSERTRVYVGYQKVEQDGTKSGVPVFNNIGSIELSLVSRSGEITSNGAKTPDTKEEKMSDPKTTDSSAKPTKQSVDDGAGTPDAKKEKTKSEDNTDEAGKKEESLDQETKNSSAKPTKQSVDDGAGTPNPKKNFFADLLKIPKIPKNLFGPSSSTVAPGDGVEKAKDEEDKQTDSVLKKKSEPFKPKMDSIAKEGEEEETDSVPEKKETDSVKNKSLFSGINLPALSGFLGGSATVAPSNSELDDKINNQPKKQKPLASRVSTSTVTPIGVDTRASAKLMGSKRIVPDGQSTSGNAR